MAVLKHIASTNADYGEAQRYLMFQYDEYTGKPILEENGRLIPRKEYYLDGINCDPFTFDMECRELNAQYHKNQTYDEIKSHHYILSFDFPSFALISVISVTHFFNGSLDEKSRFSRSSDFRASRSALVIPLGLRFGRWMRPIFSMTR